MNMVVEPQLSDTNSFKEVHVEACSEVNAARSAQDGQAINSITIVQGSTKGSDDATCHKNYPRGGLACSTRWLTMKALVFIASWFKAAHRIKTSPVLTPFWLSSREKTLLVVRRWR